MTEREIWNYLLEKTGSDVFTAGIMGNIKAESAFKANNLQNSFEKKLAFTDETYTDAIDNLDYSLEQFMNDGAGYGLCQWTYWSRKQGLYMYWYEKYMTTCSIGDTKMQLDYMLYEMKKKYPSLWNGCEQGFYKTVYQAARDIMVIYERPADQSDKAVQKRADYAQSYFDLHAGQHAETPAYHDNEKWNKLHDLLMEAVNLLESTNM